MKTSEINIRVTTDENQLPQKLEWQAGSSGSGNCKSLMLALWDEKENNTMRIDLWTKDMLVDEMKKFYLQNVLTLTDTFVRATGDAENAEKIRQFFVGLG